MLEGKKMCGREMDSHDECTSASATNKIPDCEVCGTSQAKYTCPKCEVRTCSLTCVNIHKKELECDGIRDKTKYKPLKSFTDLDVLSDYRLLEEVGRSVDQLKRNPFKKCTRQAVLPMHLHKLKAATFRRNINLQFMPQNFSRHKENTTFLNWKSNELFWRVEWIFPQAECTKCVTERALESIRLGTLVEHILDPVGTLEDRSDIEQLNLRLALSERLQFYQAAGLQGVKVLLKAERVIKSNSKFYELDLTLTLQENLEHKVLIEFPTLYVILKNHLDMYEIIDSDDEEFVSKVNRNGGNVSSQRKMQFNKRPKQDKNGSVNYFFNSDFSDSDNEKPNENYKSRSSALDIPDYNQLVKREH